MVISNHRRLLPLIAQNGAAVGAVHLAVKLVGEFVPEYIGINYRAVAGKFLVIIIYQWHTVALFLALCAMENAAGVFVLAGRLVVIIAIILDDAHYQERIAKQFLAACGGIIAIVVAGDIK